MMKRIYLDNGSTSFPKAPGVSDAVKHFMDEIGTNVNRGGYQDAYEAEDVIVTTREQLCRLFHFPKASNVVFTPNITYSLNYIIKGLFKPGDHLLISSMEHNAMMRPLNQMTEQGVTFDRIPCDQDGFLQTDQIAGLIRPNTKAILMLHASNVCGTVMPLQEVGEICAAQKIAFIVDAAQTAGSFPIDMQKMKIDALAFTGHKSLLGPQGIGGFLVSDALAEQMDPLIAGGTGSLSDSEKQPTFMPDKFESGTMNIPGIYGLHAALSYLEKVELTSIRRHEMELTKIFMERVSAIPGVRLVGTADLARRTAVISFDFTQRDNAEISFLLDSQYGINTRCGLHCAPNAHKTLGTFPQGTVRFAIGFQNTLEEINYTAAVLQEILCG